MVGAVDERHLEVNHREAGEHAGPEHALEALFDARYVFLRYRTADDLVLEFEAGTGRTGLRDDLHARVLPRAAGLLLVRVINRRSPRNLLTIGDLRRADVRVDLVGALQDVDLDV